MAFCTSSPTLFPNLRRLTYPMLLSSILLSTISSFIFALVIVNFNGSFFPLLTTSTLTFVPSFPFNIFTVSAAVRESISLSSTFVILSPIFIPTFSAGLPINGETTSSASPFFLFIVIPTPTYSPSISSEKFARSSFERYSEYGSFNLFITPATAPL